MLKVTCLKCGTTGLYAMSDEELAIAEEYKQKGRAMGKLGDLLPNIPKWILYGALDPMAGGRCMCPSCQKK